MQGAIQPSPNAAPSTSDVNVKKNVTLNVDSHAIESSGQQMLASIMQLDVYAAIIQTLTTLTGKLGVLEAGGLAHRPF